MSIPSSPTLEMTPRNLWAVWSAPNPVFVRSGVADRVEQDWVLASEGSQGLKEITGQTGERFVAALPLEDVLKAWAALEELERGWVGKAFERYLPFSLTSYVVLMKDHHDVFRWHPLRTKSPEEAVEAASGFGEVVSWGRLDDLKGVVETGRLILGSKDYSRILADTRPESAEHPIWWLFSRQKPHLMGAVHQLLED